jgi:hypothetical protein
VGASPPELPTRLAGGTRDVSDVGVQTPPDNFGGCAARTISRTQLAGWLKRTRQLSRSGNYRARDHVPKEDTEVWEPRGRCCSRLL